MPRNVDVESPHKTAVLNSPARAATRLADFQGILLRRRARMRGDSERRRIPIIDIFAGPGGLGEGFAVLKDAKGRPVFDLKLSIEKDEYAWRTLLLGERIKKMIPMRRRK